MGRLVILLLIIVTIVMLWKAFGPGSGTRLPKPNGAGGAKIFRNRNQRQVEAKPAGPDDDSDFLWNIEKERFKKRREAERAEEQRLETERLRRQREEKLKRPEDPEDPSAPPTPPAG